MPSADDFPQIDTQTASAARCYDHMLGGTDNYEIDRRTNEALEDMHPGTFAMARNNRRYLERLVRYLAGECGIRQFIEADACDTDRVLGHPETQRLINFDEPVAALFISFFHNVPDARDPVGVVRHVSEWHPDGSGIRRTVMASLIARNVMSLTPPPCRNQPRARHGP